MDGYIYSITNKVNNKKYIGCTNDYNLRIKRHKSELRGNYHYNEHLQRAWNKYGGKLFSFQILKKINECTYEELYKEEIKYIAKYGTFNGEGYNQTKGGEGLKGIKRSEETRRKMSKAKIGKKLTEEHKKKISKNNGCYWKGKTLPEEIRQKIREAKSAVSKEIGIEIYKLYKSAELSYREIANKYNISKTTVGEIVRKEHWSTRGL